MLAWTGLMMAAGTVRGERILVPLAASMEDLDSLYVLNETASFIWQGVGRGCSDTEIAAQLAEAYEVSPELALEDTRTVLEDLSRLKAVHAADA